jgi:hypothetical protein
LTVVFGACLYLAGLVARIYMLRTGLFSFLSSSAVAESRIAEAQVWNVIYTFGLDALILFAIEARYHPADKVRAGIFWAILASESFWGLISGMKSLFLFNLVAVALVSSLVRRKLQIRWLALTTLALIAIYPLISTYRILVRPKVTDSITSLSAATEAMRGAAMRSADQERTASDWAAQGWASSVTRIDMTQDVALLLAYRDRSYLLEGDCRMWMIPFYPFVPRFLWPGKPVEDVGSRFTRLLTGGVNTCTSTTIPGDLYILHGGIPGLLAGMFVVGLSAQLLTNPVRRSPSKRNLFVYACMFFSVANWENDFFAYSTGVIRSFVVIQILALIIFGPPRVRSRVGALVGRAVRRR